MAEIASLSTTDASNTGRWPENMPPSAVNNAGRADEGMLARWHKDTNGSLASTGSANAYALAINRTDFAASSTYDGYILTFEANFANTGAATLNVTPSGGAAVGAKSIKKNGTVALASGDIASGQKVIVCYDYSTDTFQMLSQLGNTPITSLTTASLTRGKVLVGNSSGVAAEVGVGTADYALVSDGTDAAWGAVARPALANTFTKAQGTTDQVLTDGATITPDASLQNNGYVILGGNRTLGVPSNLTALKRQAFEFDIYQDSTGSRTLAYAWVYKWAGGTAGTLTTTALARDKLFGNVCYYGTSAVTITIAAPGVVSWTSHGLKTGDQIQITTTGALPTGLTASTTYFVIKNDANSFWLATSRANAAAGTKITTSGSQSGTHTAVACEIDLALNKAYS